MDASFHPNWVEIDLSAIVHNLGQVKKHIGAQKQIMAVVKSNAYGHGAIPVARTALANGATSLAVSSIAEAVALREAGIQAPILVLTYITADTVPLAMQHDISVAVFDPEIVGEFYEAARKTGGILRVQVKMDSGMGRLGVFPEATPRLVREISKMSHIYLEGIYTHFSSADEDPHHTQHQIDTFKKVVEPLQAAGIRFEFIHASNSAGILTTEDDFFNVVRSGLLVYGATPSAHVPPLSGLHPAMTWKTKILQIRDFPANSPIGYGNTYYTSTQERIAILPVGYADGLHRSPQTWHEVLICGKRAPLVGRVSMEKIAVNISHIPQASRGDEVVLLGKQGDDEISAAEIAEWLGTIHYDVITSILPGAPRHYVNSRF